MARSGQRKPLRAGALVLRDGLLVRVGHIAGDFAPHTSIEKQRDIGRQLQRACQFYVAYRDGEITPSRFREQIRSLKKSADNLHRRLSALLPFTRAELYISPEGRSGGVDGVERYLQLLIARLEEVQAEESIKGRDHADTPGSLLVKDLLLIFMALKGRTRPPAVRFDAKRDVEDPDDVSSVEFGRFVMAVEAAIISSVSSPTSQLASRYRLRDKRAAISGAIRRFTAN